MDKVALAAENNPNGDLTETCGDAMPGIGRGGPRFGLRKRGKYAIYGGMLSRFAALRPVSHGSACDALLRLRLR